MSSESRVSIPDNASQTIRHIREITGKLHSDEDIYTVLRECSMDPNETIQKLLFLDTFHVVKRKPRRKEISSSRAPEDSRSSTHTQGRGARVVQGNYSSHHVSSDAGGGRNSASRRENGAGQRNDRGPVFSSSQVLQKTKNDIAPYVTKVSSAIPNGPTKLPSGSSSPVHATPVNCVIDALQDCSVEMNKDTTPPMFSVVADEHPSKNIPTFGSVIGYDQPKSSANSDQTLSSGIPSSAPTVHSFASDTDLVSTRNSRHQSAVGSQQIVAEQNHNQIDKHISHSAGDSELSKNEDVPYRNMSSKLKAVEKAQVSDPPQSSSLGTHDDPAIRSSSVYNDQPPQEPIAPSAVAEPEVAAVCAKPHSQPVPDSNVSARQHVTFPDHFQVPEALKNRLTFGSFDTNFGLSIKSDNSAGENYSPPAVEPSQGSDDTAIEHPSQNVTIVHEGDGLHDVTTNVIERGLSEANVASGVLSQYDQVKQDTLSHSKDPQNPTIQNATNYSQGPVPSVPGSQLVQFEGPGLQARDVSSLPNFVDGNSSVVSTPTPTPSPPIIQSTGTAPFPYYRHPYPPNYFPYGPYFSPYFMPPMHPYLGLNGLPQQPSYIPAAGVKYPVPQFKAGPNPGNPTQVGLPSGYGSYGYGPGVAVSSGSSAGGEDHGASQLKENHTYTTGQMSEGSAVWYSAPGQDMLGLPFTSLYNLPPHVPYPSMQVGHNPYPGIYQQPSQTLAAPSTVMQPPQTVAGGAESVGPQSGVYQQTQLAQMNWNGNGNF